MATMAIGLWEADQKEALKEYLKKVTAGCVELMAKSQKIATTLEGCNKTKDGEAVESVLGSFHKYCAEQIEGIKELVTDLAKNEKNLEEAKGDTTGWGDEVLAAVNSIEYAAWKPVNYVVGGRQLTKEAMEEISASFSGLRDTAQDVLTSSGNAVSEMHDSKASFAEAFQEIHGGIKTVFTGMVDDMNKAKKDFRVLVEDAEAITKRFGTKAGTMAGDVSQRSIASAKEVKKDVKQAVDSMV